MDDADKKLLLKNVSNIEDMEPFLDTDEVAIKRRRRHVSITLAILFWLVTPAFAAYSGISADVVNGSSAKAQLLCISFLGLILVLFSNKAIASYTAFPMFYSWMPINRPTPQVLLRLLGWIFLLGVVLLFALN